MVEQLKCPNCGGHINSSRMVCEYCGTQFKRDANTLYISTFTPKVEVVHGRIMLREEILEHLGSEETSRYAVDALARMLAKELRPLMELRTMPRPETMQREICGTLRVLRPDYRF